MQKTAQKKDFERGFFTNLKEITNISGAAAEKFFNPEFQKVMNDLRSKDDQIRSIAAGETIGDGDPGRDHISLKQLLKQAKSNLNRREYMSAVADLGRFHAKLYEIVNVIWALDNKVNEIHHQFLFKDLDDDRRTHLQEMSKRLAAQRNAQFVKEAGIMDFFHNIGTTRGRALAAWEKRYPKQTQKLKKETTSLLQESEKLLSLTITSLKEMASARANRDVDTYMNLAEKIANKYTSYDVYFKKYYTENVKGFLEKANFLGQTPSDVKDSTKTDSSKNVNDSTLIAPVVPSLPTGSTAPVVPSLPTSTNVSGSTTQLPGPPLTPTGPMMPESLTKTNPAPAGPMSSNPPASTGEENKSDKIYQQILAERPDLKPQEDNGNVRDHVSAHSYFYRSLRSLSNESPILLASYITKYAKSIQHTDPETSVQLFQIVKRIKG